MKDKKLIIFDVDGVLLNGPLGGFKDILTGLGKQKEADIVIKKKDLRELLKKLLRSTRKNLLTSQFSNPYFFKTSPNKI